MTPRRGWANNRGPGSGGGQTALPVLNPAALNWSRVSDTRLNARIMLGAAMLRVVAVEARIIDDAWLEPACADDLHLFRLIHDLSRSPGILETFMFRKKRWLCAIVPEASTR